MEQFALRLHLHLIEQCRVGARYYKPVASANAYFASDSSGLAVYDTRSGDTHFLHLDSNIMKELLAAPVLSLDDLQLRLSLSDEEASELVHEMIFLGLINESD